MLDLCHVVLNIGTLSGDGVHRFGYDNFCSTLDCDKDIFIIRVHQIHGRYVAATFIAGYVIADDIVIMDKALVQHVIQSDLELVLAVERYQL